MIPARAPEPLVPPLALAILLTCIAGAAALANFSVLAALLRSSRNGLSSIIIQLCVADFLIIVTLAGELWFYNIRTWSFGNECCTAYRGINEFASTAISYLIATAALHTIATVNLEEKIIEKRLKRTRCDDEDEMKSSHHSLVASSNSSTPLKTMNVDYRLATTRVRVTPPAVFIWILAGSLSIPQFVSAITVTISEQVTLCTVKDSYHNLYMNGLLSTFNLFVPIVIMFIALILVISKLKSSKLFHVDMNDSIAALKLSICLIVVYCVFCVPRSVVTVHRVFSRDIENQNSPIVIDQMNDTMSEINLAFTITYLIASVIRPMLSIFMLPKCREHFKLRSKILSEV